MWDTEKGARSARMRGLHVLTAYALMPGMDPCCIRRPSVRSPRLGVALKDPADEACASSAMAFSEALVVPFVD